MQIGVVGSGVCSNEIASLAFEVGQELARCGAVLVCGGLSGVMESACKGAKEAGGTTVGILPGTDAKDANPYVDIPIVTGLGEARNIIVARSAQAIIAISGGYGTLSEIAFALRLSIPVIGLKTWALKEPSGKTASIIEANTPPEAVKAALAAGKKWKKFNTK